MGKEVSVCTHGVVVRRRLSWREYGFNQTILCPPWEAIFSVAGLRRHAEAASRGFSDDEAARARAAALGCSLHVCVLIRPRLVSRGSHRPSLPAPRL